MTTPSAISKTDLIDLCSRGQPICQADIGSIDWLDFDMSELHLKECVAKNVVFENVTIDGFKTENCQFVDCTFKSCDIREVQFVNCGFVNKDGHTGCSWRFCSLEHGNFDGCDVSFARFERCDLYELKIEDSLFRAADFSTSSFSRELSRTKKLTALEIHRSNLAQSTWLGLSLDSINVTQSDLTEAVMAECELTGAVLTECNLTNAELLSADLTGANLSGSNLSGLDLRSLKSYQGLMILGTQQRQLLRELGIDVL